MRTASARAMQAQADWVLVDEDGQIVEDSTAGAGGARDGGGRVPEVKPPTVQTRDYAEAIPVGRVKLR